MNKFFDYLEMDLSLPVIRELSHYIRRFVAAMGDDVPMEGRMGTLGFCASLVADGFVRVHWVQIGRDRIAVDAVI